jgi:hypothetical protein
MVLAAGARGLSPQRLYRFYLASAAAFPELYDGSSFYNWLDFLERSRLITMTQERIVLTPEGREFLDYVSTEVVGRPAAPLAS